MTLDRFRIGAIAGLLVVLAGIFWSIHDKHSIMQDGRLLLLEMAPVDPIEFLLGHYMDLAYAEGRNVKLTDLPPRGLVVVSVGPDGVGHLKRADTGGDLAPDELRIPFRARFPRWSGDTNREFILGADRFYFAEDQVQCYEIGHYVMMRVDDGGRILMVGMADENKKPLDCATQSALP